MISQGDFAVFAFCKSSLDLSMACSLFIDFYDSMSLVIERVSMSDRTSRNQRARISDRTHILTSKQLARHSHSQWWSERVSRGSSNMSLGCHSILYNPGSEITSGVIAGGKCEHAEKALTRCMPLRLFACRCLLLWSIHIWTAHASRKLWVSESFLSSAMLYHCILQHLQEGRALWLFYFRS